MHARCSRTAPVLFAAIMLLAGCSDGRPSVAVADPSTAASASSANENALPAASPPEPTSRSAGVVGVARANQPSDGRQEDDHPDGSGSDNTGISSSPYGDPAGRDPARDDAAWSRWRGPGGRGIVAGARLPEVWPEALPLLWQVPLGTGWSSPVVADGHVFVTDRQQNQERLLAIDAATGRVTWSVENPVDFDPHPVGRRHGNGPKATPLVAGGRVYSLGIAGWLQCVDAGTGKRIWSRSLPRDFARTEPLPEQRAYVNGTQDVVVPIGMGQGGAVPLFGYTASPLLDQQRLILQVGGERGATLMAFAPHSGRELWRSLDDHVSYSSPIVAEIETVRQVVAMTGSRIVGLDVRDGRLLWHHPFQIQYDESIATPVVAGNLVLVTGDGHPLTALRIGRRGESWRAELAWKNDELSSYVSSPVAALGCVFGMNDDGEFVCVDLSSGKTRWRGGNHGFHCSPVVAGEELLGLNETGELAVLRLRNDLYEPLALVTLSERPTWSVPAVVGRRMFVRADGRLLAFELNNAAADTLQ